MITRHAMMEPMLAALPALEPKWQAFVAEWRDNPYNTPKSHPDDLPNYLFLGDLAAYLADCMQEGDEESVRKALAVCERWLVEGEHYVSEAATVGLLEDLQNYAQRRNIAFARIEALLGPEGQRWWHKVNAFWSKGELLVDETKLPEPERSAADIWKVIPKILWDMGRKK
jgi:hypothetical protein